LGERHVERRLFIDWLSRQQFDMPGHALNAAPGDEMRISIP
jgi:hypothetical protein